MLRNGFNRRCGSHLVLAWLVIGQIPSMASAFIDSPSPVVNPVPCHSPSGKFSFTVDPTDLHGEGAGNYVLKRNGQEVWSEQRPWTLQMASMTDAVRQAGIAKRVTSHTFRHSFATHLMADGYDIRTVRELLGHNDVRTTII